MRRDYLFLYVLFFCLSAKANDSIQVNKKYTILVDGGISAISFNNKTRMQVGAITPTLHFYYNKKYSIKVEYYKFSYFYSSIHNSSPYQGKYGGTDFIETKSGKIAFGKLFYYKFLYLNPYISFNYRKSEKGHNFYWPLENNQNHDLTTAYSPFNSPGVGVGGSLNLLLLKHVNFSIDFSYSRYFDKKRIYAYEDYGSSEKTDVSDKWPDYKPLNNVIALQLKIGYLFGFN
jgi:hypothetical protein